LKWLVVQSNIFIWRNLFLRKLSPLFVNSFLFYFKFSIFIIPLKFYLKVSHFLPTLLVPLNLGWCYYEHGWV